MYPVELTAPMMRDLTEAGFESLHSAADVDVAMADKDGTALVVINSVCGCAAAMARPGVKLALKEGNKPDKLYTVFAGVDREATERAREYLLPYPPSSPSVALFKNGNLVHFLERHHIEGANAQMIAANLKAAFDEYCAS